MQFNGDKKNSGKKKKQRLCSDKRKVLAFQPFNELKEYSIAFSAENCNCIEHQQWVNRHKLRQNRTDTNLAPCEQKIEDVKGVIAKSGTISNCT